MVRHFETKKQARQYKAGLPPYERDFVRIYKKIKGHKNRGKKPFVVCSEIEWLNLY